MTKHQHKKIKHFLKQHTVKQLDKLSLDAFLFVSLEKQKRQERRNHKLSKTIH
jgi:hypothetical protein